MSRPALVPVASPVAAALLVLAGFSVSACQVLPYDHDVIPVSKRYANQYDGPCSSWLRSAKTGYRYCASPAIVLAPVAVAAAPAPAPAAAPKAEGERKTDLESLRTEGKRVYEAMCITCHGAEGKGIPGAFPPLAGSGEFYGDPQNMARILVHGLSGEIVVQGQTYNGMMPGQGMAFDDYELAAAATYVRTSWGNDDGIVLPSDVAAVR